MLAAQGGGDAVAGHGLAAGLQPFLQLGLRVLGPGGGGGAVQVRADQALDHGRRRGQAGIQLHGADQRLHGVREDRGALRPAAAGLALGQADQAGQAQLDGDLVQRFLAHQVRAHAAELALVGLRVAAVEQPRHAGREHGIAQEFEALVVVAAEALVGQRPAQQGGVGEAVAQALLQLLGRALAGRLGARRGRRLQARRAVADRGTGRLHGGFRARPCRAGGCEGRAARRAAPRLRRRNRSRSGRPRGAGRGRGLRG